jgi:hypothetical protein
MVRIYLGKIGAAAVCCVGVWGLADPGNFGWPGSAGKEEKPQVNGKDKETKMCISSTEKESFKKRTEWE